MSNEPARISQGALLVFGAVVVGVAMIGFLRGTAHDDYTFITPITAVHASANEATGLHPARSYREMRNGAIDKGSRFDKDLERLEQKLPTRLDPVEIAGTKAQNTAARAARRAYDGAPPTIPHPVRQRSMSECKACHENGLSIAGRNAPAYPHPSYQSCTQCHAMDSPNLPWGDRSVGADPRDVPNSFSGLAAPEEGPRWTDVAPPQIPHKTFMHERCGSCHGTSGRNAMRSTHPDRQNCEQCHAPQAALEWRPGGRK